MTLFVIFALLLSWWQEEQIRRLKKKLEQYEKDE
jgi:hypothetical protein